MDLSWPGLEKTMVEIYLILNANPMRITLTPTAWKNYRNVLECTEVWEIYRNVLECTEAWENLGMF